MKFLAAALACVISAYAVAVYLAVPANPEIELWSTIAERRAAEIASIRQELPGERILLFTGGSSCAFSIDPRIVEEICGLPAINVGLPVSAGAEYLLHQALQRARANDIIVVCLEPDLLTDSTEPGSPTSFSMAMSIARGQPSEAAGGDTFGSFPDLSDYLNLCRPGPRYLATASIKAMTGRGYRYRLEDLKYRGRMETSIHDSGMKSAGARRSGELAPSGERLLRCFSRAANARGVAVVYSMPWYYTAEEDLEVTRASRNSLMDKIAPIMPVIKDGFAGASEEVIHFSDTPLHLTAKGSRIRSSSVALSLRKWLRSSGG